MEYIKIIIICLVITAIITCGYKGLQKLCMYVCFKNFQNENTWYCRFFQKHASTIFGIGIGRRGHKIKDVKKKNREEK